MKQLRPFFCFYGGKWRTAGSYPPPRHQRVVEPFAGAAGYSTRLHWQHDVILIEKDPRVARLWRWLTHRTTTSAVIKTLPLWESAFETTADSAFRSKLPTNTTEAVDAASDLIGFWLNKGTTGPCKKPSTWMLSGIRPKSYWGAEVRHLLSEQVEAIKHWSVIEGDWSRCTEFSPTSFFIDPPYEQDGSHYKCSSASLDFKHLGGVCLSLASGGNQVVVCENEGASWLPFRKFRTIKATPGKQKKTDSSGKHRSVEVVWTDDMQTTMKPLFPRYP